MEDSLLLKLITGLLAVIVALIGVLMGFLKKAFEEHIKEDKEYHRSLDALTLHLASNYVKKDEMNALQGEINKRFDKLDAKLDRLLEKK